ncbi:MAG: hypothetical protein U9R74_00095 [Pseudomonadota bacterium]|nr:hypothetical protein [Pseudomonadota bacterium]
MTQSQIDIDAKLVRKNCLVTKANARKLGKLAKSEGCSEAEIVRRAIDVDEPGKADSGGQEALLDLVEERPGMAVGAVRCTP